MDCVLKYNFSAAEREAYQKSTHCQNVTNYSFITRHFMMQGEYTAGYWLPTSEAVHLSANNIMQGASTQSTSIPFHIVIRGRCHKSFQNILAINTHVHM